MSAKEIQLRPIEPKRANALVRRLHYSGGVKTNSQIHIGVFYRGALEGALQFGPSIDKHRMRPLVEGTRWNGFLELNRMAFSDRLPRNSESRGLAVACRLLRRHAPQVKWVVSFADATQCGDGTIYRAAGFLLVGIKKNTTMQTVNGAIVSTKTLSNARIGGRYGSRVAAEHGAEPLPGFQIKYIRFIDPTWRPRLTVPVLPYAAIEEAGARMYKGERSADSGTPAPAGGGGATPTRSLQPGALGAPARADRPDGAPRGHPARDRATRAVYTAEARHGGEGQ